jgi:hypothetical protein
VTRIAPFWNSVAVKQLERLAPSRLDWEQRLEARINDGGGRCYDADPCHRQCGDGPARADQVISDRDLRLSVRC